ncbi:cytidine deaminase [Roseivirga echinicomitans]|uniref:cytidine deaminase n=1 Tax=Roseivirga echinicomitans TaxID=296218 RepID=UPI000A07879F|nr:cytidine deaminase [Roseivirga echinicomitans]|tara:strand:- start:402 stop:890 length:489 start_codon:yes stop_codon:yes gene_type:complete
MAKRIVKEVSLTQYEANELDQVTLELIEAAKKAALNAYSPYSNFQVGAALLLDNGKTISGNNQENACYPAGLCAERVAFFSAKSQYPDCQIMKVAIVAKPANQEQFKMATPCGSCRQVMSEYENNQEQSIKVYLPDADGSVYESDSIDNFLPFKFSNKDLNS